MKKIVAEFIGTMWLVLGGCGSAVIAAGVPNIGIGLVGVSLAFGLTVLTGAYALGHISGGHFNPAVSVGLWIGGRFDKKDLQPAEIMDFIMELPTDKFNLLGNFLRRIPKLEKEVEFDCTKCGHHNTLTLSGMKDFLV